MNGGAVTQSGTSLPFGAEQRTLETWVLARQNVPCNYAVDMGSYGVDSPGEQFYVQLADDGGGSEMQLFTGGPTPAASIGLPGSWDDGAYHLMAASYDGNVFTAYMDGQAAGSAVVGALSTVAQAFEFGPGGFMNWDEYTVIPTALAPDRLDSHWTHGSSTLAACPPTPTTPYATSVESDHPSLYYRLDDTGEIFADSSAHCHDGSTSAAGEGPRFAFAVGGALRSDPDTTIAMNGGAVTQSGTSLPFGAEQRTLETWVLARQNVPCNYAVDMGSYGVDSPGEQFYVQLADDGGGSEMQLFTGGPTPRGQHRTADPVGQRRVPPHRRHLRRQRLHRLHRWPSRRVRGGGSAVDGRPGVRVRSGRVHELGRVRGLPKRRSPEPGSRITTS